MDVINTIGRRKTAVARVYLTKGKGAITVNKKSFADYFPVESYRQRINQPFAATETEGKFDVKVNVSGGGIKGQAEATMLAIARALVKNDEDSKPALRQLDLLTRDPRMVERKKFGQPKARKKFQFSKR